MHADSEREDEDIKATIDLTSKLEQSLRKLLTKKKSMPADIFALASPRHGQQEEARWESRVRLLQEENRELHQDNQELSRQLLLAREQLRECQKELSGSQKYLAFLQAYNDDLKKEMLFWMKSRREPQDEPSSVNQLMSKIMRLRRENEENEKKLISLKDTVEVKVKPNSHTPSHNQSLSFDLSKFHNDFIRRRNSQPNDCTSCSYKSKSRSKSKGNSKSKQKNHHPQQAPSNHFSNKEGNASRKVGNGQSSKGKNLRKWHNHYVSNSEFAY